MLDGSFEGVGIQLNQDQKTKEVEVITPIEGSPAFKAGVFAGDVILKVDNQPIAGLSIEDVTKRIKGKVGTSVTLHVRHTTGDEADLTMKREEIVMSTVKGFKRTQSGEWDWYVAHDPKIAYIRITQFTPDTADRVKEALAGGKNGWKGLLADGMKGLILDLRFNPGGRLDQAVQLDRRVSTFECKTGTKSVAGKDWMVPSVTDEKVVAKLLDAGGINLC